MIFHKRSKKYIDPKVQGALVRRIILHWISFVIVAYVATFLLQVLSNPFRSLGEHAMQVWSTYGIFFLVMACLLPAFILDTVRISHRFTGPIYRLRNMVGSIAAGEPTRRLKFRKHDYWPGLADDFNTMVERLTKGEDYLGENEPADKIQWNETATDKSESDEVGPNEMEISETLVKSADPC